MQRRTPLRIRSSSREEDPRRLGDRAIYHGAHSRSVDRGKQAQLPRLNLHWSRARPGGADWGVQLVEAQRLELRMERLQQQLDS
eukprot:787851-Rhodomonas_salina.4